MTDFGDANASHRGLFVVFEGPDGSGKTTISTAIGDRLLREGLHLSAASFPGKEPRTLGELVYRLHHNSSAVGVSSITPAAIQALHIAAHLDAIESRLRPRVLAGDYLVLDRFWWSTWVYGVVGGVTEQVLNPLIEAEVEMWGQAKPDVIFLVQRSTPINREMSRALFDTLSSNYDRLARRERARHHVVILNNDADAASAIEIAIAELRSLAKMPRKADL